MSVRTGKTRPLPLLKKGRGQAASSRHLYLGSRVKPSEQTVKGAGKATYNEERTRTAQKSGQGVLGVPAPEGRAETVPRTLKKSPFIPMMTRERQDRGQVVEKAGISQDQAYIGTPSASRTIFRQSRVANSKKLDRVPSAMLRELCTVYSAPYTQFRQFSHREAHSACDSQHRYLPAGNSCVTEGARFTEQLRGAAQTGCRLILQSNRSRNHQAPNRSPITVDRRDSHGFTEEA